MRAILAHVRIATLAGIAGFLLLLSPGCSGEKAAEGKVKIESTSVFKNLKGTKSPPPKVPPP